ncbi:nucleotide sugar dehydrogenase [Thioalkalivibrio paradoxus]|uniref:Vi polysaccharide biosynthesis protein vipA/tviB n=1 Tax=Thioalkalivibrio paradoxus ARh 1 TaxID=713585 RepID=W0DKT1_9GAMM|nr:nucleotide sugar dehydrogenase [Thioalkalivibrio paradoxus]AHE97842.1 Vi polysaccharide biosynthesis protein vipA/tviB [Thioalkalivibrio paradoxus ARh 1]
MTLAIIGLGYVGLPLAVEFAKRRDVIGFDINAARIAALQGGHDATLEVADDELRQTMASGRLRFTTDPQDIAACTTYIITVPTPITEEKRPDLRPLLSASKTVGQLLKPGDLVIYESTVYPGCTEEDCVPILERESGLKYITAAQPSPSSRETKPSAARSEATWQAADAAVQPPPGSPPALATASGLAMTGPRDDADAPSLRGGRQADVAIHENGFHVGYSPERINPGDKEHRVSTIRKVTSGSTPEAAERVDALYREIITAGTHKAESIRVAEAAKVIENTQRDLNIALMNELSVLFARLGIDTEAVLRAAGTKWNFLPFRPGLVGGHCIGVDPYYLTHKAEKIGYIPQVILSGRRINDNMGRYVARSTLKKMIQNGCDVTKATVGVLGLTFKENCPDLRNSRVIDIIRELQDYGVRVIAEDPHADPEEVAQEYPQVTLGAITPETPVDALVVAVGHDVYAERDADTVRAHLRGESPVLADVKSLYDRHALAAAGITVWRL